MHLRQEKRQTSPEHNTSKNTGRKLLRRLSLAGALLIGGCSIHGSLPRSLLYELNACGQSEHCRVAAIDRIVQLSGSNSQRADAIRALIEERNSESIKSLGLIAQMFPQHREQIALGLISIFEGSPDDSWNYPSWEFEEDEEPDFWYTRASRIQAEISGIRLDGHCTKDRAILELGRIMLLEGPDSELSLTIRHLFENSLTDEDANVRFLAVGFLYQLSDSPAMHAESRIEILEMLLFSVKSESESIADYFNEEIPGPHRMEATIVNDLIRIARENPSLMEQIVEILERGLNNGDIHSLHRLLISSNIYLSDAALVLLGEYSADESETPAHSNEISRIYGQMVGVFRSSNPLLRVGGTFEAEALGVLAIIDGNPLRERIIQLLIENALRQTSEDDERSDAASWTLVQIYFAVDDAELRNRILQSYLDGISESKTLSISYTALSAIAMDRRASAEVRGQLLLVLMENSSRFDVLGVESSWFICDIIRAGPNSQVESFLNLVEEMLNSGGAENLSRAAEYLNLLFDSDNCNAGNRNRIALLYLEHIFLARGTNLISIEDGMLHMQEHPDLEPALRGRIENEIKSREESNLTRE